MESLANEVALAPATSDNGVWQRHIPARYLPDALKGRVARSRWGTAGGFPILHLGAPTNSVIVEAYRHLVDPVEDDVLSQLAPRRLVTCRVSVTDLLDLRTSTARMTLGLPMSILTSETHDREAYETCQRVAATAHQLGLHGLITPAATTMGETLALFTQNLPDAQRPILLDDELWDTLPADPRRQPGRRLRVVSDDPEGN